MTNKNEKVTKKASFKQKLLRTFYPLIRKLGKKGRNGTILTNVRQVSPIKSLYDLDVILSSGERLNLAEFKGRNLLLVNTASNCGYTGQYAELQSLYEQYGNKLSIIAFPANDFAEQEKSNDREIAQFCELNYGVSFPIAKKGIVIKHEEQQAIFNWLTNKQKNGWNDHEPDWNFSKYLIDAHGNLSHYFGPSISPLEKIVIDTLK